MVEVCDSRYPIRKKEASFLLENIPTKLFAAAYNDHILLIITQQDDIGSLVRILSFVFFYYMPWKNEIVISFF